MHVKHNFKKCDLGNGLEGSMKKQPITKKRITVSFCMALYLVASCVAQSTRTDKPNKRLDTAEFTILAQHCAPSIPIITLRAIARAESAFRPYALSLNYPKRTAREQGLDGALFLARQPRSIEEARAWTRWLSDRGRSVSVGLLQINSEQAAGLGLTPEQLFDPCTNMRAGAHLLSAYYRQASAVLGEGQQALQYALSGYNSGFPLVGFGNGYVDAVISGEFPDISQTRGNKRTRSEH